MTGSGYIVFTLLAFFSYCIWGFMNGIASKEIDSYSALFFSSVGYLVASLFFLLMKGGQLDYSTNCIINGTILGLATGVGGFFVLLAMNALNNNNLSVVILITSTYPIGTLLLNVLYLNEPLNFLKLFGFVVVIAGVVLVSL